MKFLFKCNGCWVEEIPFLSSQLAAESRRHIVSLALSLAFFISGQGYASYRKTLGKGLGNRETLSSNCWLSITTHKTNP